MATLNDPRAASFDETKFRDGIIFAMGLGLPDNKDERITFRWTTKKDYPIADAGGNPYSWTSDPSKIEKHPDVQVPAAIKFSPRTATGSDNGPFGQINNPIIEVTILDEQYELVKTANLIVLADAEYTINFVKPPDGLFGVTIYTIFASALDEF